MAAGSKNVIARGASEVAGALASQAATRDALLDPQPDDFIPDVDDKGLHVGTVRQPAEPVLRAGGVVEYESTGSGESKFQTFADQVRANSAWEQEQGDLYEGRAAVVGIDTDPATVAERKAALTKEQSRASSRSSEDKSDK